MRCLKFVSVACVILLCYAFVSSILDMDTVRSHESSIPSSPPLLTPEQLIKPHPKLKRPISAEMHAEIVSLASEFATLFERNDIEYIMADGTLLGSYFFHDLIPWDEDLDFMVNFKDRFKVFKLFLDPENRKKYDVRSYQSSNNTDWYNYANLAKLLNHTETSDDLKFKFFRTDSRKAGKYSQDWPYCDVKYYKVDSKQIRIFDLSIKPPSIPTEHLYRIKKRPFGDVMLNSPSNVLYFI